MSVPVLVPPKTRAQQVRSFDVADFAALTGREEEWRFTPLNRLRGLDKASGGAVGAIAPTVEVDDLPAGVTVATVDREDPRIGSVLVPFDRISALASGAATEAVLVSVARGAVPESPAVVRLVGSSLDLAYGHTYVEVGEHAEVTVVIEQTGSVTLADNVEVNVGDRARLTLVTVADWAPDAVQVQHLKFRLGRDAVVKHVQVSLGGAVVRQ